MYWSIIIQLNRVCNEKENSDSFPSPAPNFATRTAKMDRSRINFGEPLFKFIAQNKQLFVK